MLRLSVIPLALLVACEAGEDGDNEMEVITTTTLTFTPTGGGADVVAIATDPDNSGDLMIDDITLSDAEDYTLTLEFFNDLEGEDITEEVEEEDDEHQVFLTGSVISGPASDVAGAPLSHTYDDMDGDGDPLGLTNTIMTDGTGSGTLNVVLRHLPPEGGTEVKVAGLAELVASGGFGSIGGENDVDIDFNVTVDP